MISKELENLTDKVNQVTNEVRSSRMNTNTATINVNAGGIGVWIATVCCAVMLGAALVLSLIVSDQQRQIDDLGHYLQAIYAQAPGLRPTEDQQNGNDHHPDAPDEPWPNKP